MNEGMKERRDKIRKEIVEIMKKIGSKKIREESMTETMSKRKKCKKYRQEKKHVIECKTRNPLYTDPTSLGQTVASYSTEY
jgi:hypothetical protein